MSPAEKFGLLLYLWEPDTAILGGDMPVTWNPKASMALPDRAGGALCAAK
jgi:hypothetical protein